MIIRRISRIYGESLMPGDKSISHRAAMLGAISNGNVEIANFSPSADCASTVECLGALGVKIERHGATLTVHGVGIDGLNAPLVDLDCGNSGTTMRLLAGILAGQPFTSRLIGDAALSLRPMSRIIDPLSEMGAQISSANGHAPITIRGGKLKGIRYDSPTPSAQVKSCILLAGLTAAGVTEVNESVRTRDHTERMLIEMGVEVGPTPNGSLIIHGPQAPLARSLSIPGDISSAVYFMVAAACHPNSELRLPGVGINPTRSAVIETLRSAGVEIEVIMLEGDSHEPIGDIVVRSNRISKSTQSSGKLIINGNDTARLIDEIPAIAILGTCLPGGLEVRDASELRLKESDRISAITGNLRRMGCAVTEFDDGFRIGPTHLTGAEIDTRGDHRIAMAFAMAGLMADGETVIDDPACVDVSFPGFFETLQNVVDS